LCATLRLYDQAESAVLAELAAVMREEPTLIPFIARRLLRSDRSLVERLRAGWRIGCR
jgi:hypothetical protein